MNLLNQLEAWLLRRAAPLTHPRAHIRAAFIVPLLCGLLSLAMGQDDGWDMRNYHLYNPYALLNGRMGIDMSPAGFQSYFNPWLDVPYFLLTSWFPAPLAGFVFGAVHGLVFVLLAAIARRLTGDGRLPLLLAIAGIMSAAFLSELGNSMGDNLTALLVLGSLDILLRRWEQLSSWNGATARTLLAAGAVMGLGLGLKLTNVSFALGACVALLLAATAFWQRLRLAFAYGVGVLVGMAGTSGYWMFRMWHSYGNPLFPQFNNIFQSPMAQPMGVLDDGHLPKNALEAALWPFVFSRNMGRVAEVPIQQIMWPVLYLALAVWGVVAQRRRFGRAAGTGLAPQGQFLLAYFVVSYIVWVRLFSIYRYLAPLELLAPVMLWLLLQATTTPGAARRIGGWLLLATSLYVLPFTTWGHAGWARRAFSAETPVFSQPAATIVFQTSPGTPMGWLAQFMPAEVTVIGLGSGFPESPAYRAHMAPTIAAHAGPHYIMFPVATDKRATGMLHKAGIARMLWFTESASGCQRLEWLMRHVRMKAEVTPLQATATGQQCTLALQPQYRADTVAEDRATEAEVVRRMQAYGLGFDPDGCKTYQAAVGTEPYPYRLCRVLTPAKQAEEPVANQVANQVAK